MTIPVITRFAPSPTGYLHIGGARTALFNWLYARGRGGKFLLRIEDTDRARHNEQAVEAILDGLTWLGLDWDGAPVSQYERRERHADVARDMLAQGQAYRCFMTAEEITAARDLAHASHQRFESPWREADPTSAPSDIPFTIRFKAPRDGETIVADEVQGEVRFPNSALDDLIILRSDGVPTYNLAVVVDDHDMGVTHVIRGDDHLNNAARQQQIYIALDWRVPSFSHVPLIHGQDGAKLSKRHGALGVEAYRADGYLPEGLSNYLLKLGWSHGDEELISRPRALEIFDLGGINKAPARLDLDKLRSVNAHYVKQMDDNTFAEAALPFVERSRAREGLPGIDPLVAEMIRRAAPYLKERSATLADAVQAAAFLLMERPPDLSGKAGKALKREGAAATAAQAAASLELHLDWSVAESLDEWLKGFVASQGVSIGDVGPVLRAALTAGAPSPGLGAVLYSLGRDETLARLNDIKALN